MSKKQTITEARVDQLVPSTLNPRRTFDERALAELAASLKADGVLQSLLVRPSGSGTFEIVCGERRWRAAQLAGLEVVPVRVRHDLEGHDVATLEAMIAENSQRADVPPLEEADAYAELVQRGRGVPEIAAKLGRTESYVRARLKLCSLIERGREALAKGHLTIEAALGLASVDEADQDRALEVLAEDFGWNARDDEDDFAPAVVRLAHVRHALRSVMHDLSRAPWDLADLNLVPSAGACTRCPKRTGAQTDLWGESRDDRCLDRECWSLKSDALVELRRKAGVQVIEVDQTNGLVNPYTGGLTWGSGLVEVDQRPSLHPGDTDDDYELAPPWRELLDGRVPLTLVRTSAGEVIEAFDRTAAYEAIRERYPKTAEWQLAGSGSSARGSGASSGDEEWRERQRAEALEAKIRAETNRRCVDELIDLVLAGRGLDEDDFRVIVRLLMRQLWSEAVNRVAARRELKPEDGSKSSAIELLESAASTMVEAELLALLVELVVTQSVASSGLGGDPLAPTHLVGELLVRWGVDAKATAKAVKRELTKSKRKPSKASKPAAADGPPTRKTCSKCGQQGHNARSCDRRGPDAEARP